MRTDVAPEQGLFSMAFHPNYAKNHRFYLDYTDDNGDTRVVEYRSNGFRAVRRLRQLLLVREPSARDPGGQLQFGPDGLLYVGVGDGRPEGYRGKQGQNLATALAKLLRIDIDRRGARWQVVGYGLRFPWRFSFDRATGDLYLADRGDKKWEEVDVRPRAKLGVLANYGWSHYEGLETHDSTTTLDPHGELVFPVVVHPVGFVNSVMFISRGILLADSRRNSPLGAGRRTRRGRVADRGHQAPVV